MMERLQKILAARGVCSRRKAEEMITAGRVSVNGLVAVLGQSADPDQDMISQGRSLSIIRTEYSIDIRPIEDISANKQE